MPHVVPRPDLVRRVPKGFGWIDHRLRRDGFLAQLTLEDLALYVFLVLAAGPDGVSWYRKEKISDALGLSWAQFDQARQRLLERGLIAFAPFGPNDTNGFYQVLPLPE
jgi:hypothetical protein